MSQTSDIIVTWTPETSGRAASIQIRSRIVGTATWTEQAAATDFTAGTFRFSSNAPGAAIEVQMRYRSTDGTYGPWSDMSIATPNVTVAYATLTNAPTSLGAINSGEGSKLSGIQSGATVGSTLGTNFVDTTGKVFDPRQIVTLMGTSADTAAVNGIPVATFTANVSAIGAAVIANATTAAANLASAQATLNAAIAAGDSGLQTQVTNLSSSVASTANTINATISSNYNALANADTGLGQRIDGVSATVNGNTATITQNSTAIATASGKLGAYFVVSASAGDNIARLTVFADQNSGAGVLIGGNLAIAGNVAIGSLGTTADSLATTANNAAPITWVQFQGLYTFNGLMVTKTSGPNEWDYNSYSTQSYKGACQVTGLFPYQGAFIGLSDNQGQTNYPGIQYGWHRSSDGNMYIFESGNVAFAATSGGGVAFTASTVFQITYDGLNVRYYANNALIHTTGTSASRAFFAVVDIAPPGAAVRLLSFGPNADNSLANADPAARINAGTTTVSGAQITTGSITADKLLIGSTSGARTAIAPNIITVYDSNNTLRVRLGVF